ncbi:hypothetical protein MASR2M78_15070 [Treponema sp.]
MVGNFVASNIKDLNRRSVYSLLCNEGEISKADIVRQTGISAPTVTKIIDYFKEKAIVIEAGEGTIPLGRKPQMLRYSPKAVYSIGAVYDGNHLILGFVDLAGNIGPQIRRRLHSDLRQFLTNDFPEVLQELLKLQYVPTERITGIGLGLPGVVGPDKHTFSYAPFVGVPDSLDLFPFLHTLERNLGLAISIENDANAAALGEYAARSIGEVGDLLYIELGRGLGSGLILDGRLRKGPRSFTGELGYLVLDSAHSDIPGAPGWLESNIGLGDLWSVAAGEGDLKVGSLEKMVPLLALGITNICIALDVDLVVVGSLGLASFIPNFVKALQKEIDRLSMLHIHCEAPQSQGPGLAGAAALATERYLDGIFAG